MVEGGAGEGEALGCLQVGAGPDEGVVAGAAIAEGAAEGVGHGFGSFFLSLAGGPAWAAEFSVEDGKIDGDDADADHDEADKMDAAVADAGMEDDAGDGGGGDGADVAEGAEQPGCDTQLLGWRLGVEGDLVSACRGAERRRRAG